MTRPIHAGKKYRTDDLDALRSKLLSRYPKESTKELAAMIGLPTKTLRWFLSERAGWPTYEKIRAWLEAQPAKS